MGTAIGDDVILKVLGAAGSLGTLVYLVGLGIRFVQKDREANTLERQLFADTLKGFGSDMKQSMMEVKGGMEALRSTMVEIDRGHTQQTRETFNQLIQLNDKQNGAISTMVTKVEHLDGTVNHLNGTVSRLSETLEDHGTKLDAISRQLPANRSRPADKTPEDRKLEPPKS
jgi:DNA repair ATPase RecN